MSQNTHFSNIYKHPIRHPAATLALSPGLLIGGKGLASTACACAVIIQILNNPITYGYRLYTFTDTFTVKYTENVAHAHAVDTRPSFPLPLPPPPPPHSEGLGTRLLPHLLFLQLAVWHQLHSISMLIYNSCTKFKILSALLQCLPLQEASESVKKSKIEIPILGDFVWHKE